MGSSSLERVGPRLVARACMVDALRLCKGPRAAQMGEHSRPPFRRLESFYIGERFLPVFFQSCLHALLLHRGHCKWQHLWCGAQCEQHSAALESLACCTSNSVCSRTLEHICFRRMSVLGSVLLHACISLWPRAESAGLCGTTAFRWTCELARIVS